MSPNSTLNFTVDSALLSELGEKLVETVHLALVELVKNAYDADATKVIIKFTNGEDEQQEIHIIDDGNGMNFNDIDNYWMRIATTNKLHTSTSPIYGRPRTGSKGIGRFCCRRLGKKLELQTIGAFRDGRNKSYQKTIATFDWKIFIPGSNVTDIHCPGERYTLEKAQTGTTLKISALSSEWNTKGYDYLKRQLAVLVANRGVRRKGFVEDPGFEIIIESIEFEGGIKNLRNELINAGWGTLTAYINKDKQAVCVLTAMGLNKKEIISDKIFPALNDVNLTIGIIVDEKDQIRKSKILSLGTLRRILPEWGGVQIRYRGFRVYPYGDDDWLDIDHDRGLRKTTPKDELYAFAQTLQGVNPSRSLLSILSMRSYVGDVELGEEATGFEMKLNRDGFLHSRAVDELKEFVRYAIEWATIYREQYIRTKAHQESEEARQEFSDFLNEDIEPGKIVESAVKYLGQEVKSLSVSLPEPERKRVASSFEKATDAILKREHSNQTELQHLRLVASTSTLMLIFSHEVKSLLGSLEGSSSTLESVEAKISAKEAKLINNVRTELQRSKDRFKQLLGMTSLISVSNRNAKPQRLALLERLLNAKECFRLILESYEIDLDCEAAVENNAYASSILEAELYAVILNIYSNAIKSVIARGGDKRIKVSGARKDGKVILKISDTGIGLPESQFDEVFAPFVADPSGNLYKKLADRLNPQDKYIVGTGSGLGLSIAKEILLARGGTVRFLKPREPWKAELEITLP